MDFEKELMNMMRNNQRFRSAVLSLLKDVFSSLKDANFNKQQFLQKFKQKEQVQNSAVDYISRILKPQLIQMMKKVEDEGKSPDAENKKTLNTGAMEESINEAKKKSDSISFHDTGTSYIQDRHLEKLKDNEANKFKTAGENEDGGYEDHYKMNIHVDAEQSNHVESILACPDCGNTDLFKSPLNEYYECNECDSLIHEKKLAEAIGNPLEDKFAETLSYFAEGNVGPLREFAKNNPEFDYTSYENKDGGVTIDDQIFDINFEMMMDVVDEARDAF